MKKRKRKLRVVADNPTIDDDNEAGWTKEDVARYRRQHLDEIERMAKLCPELNALIDKLQKASFDAICNDPKIDPFADATFEPYLLGMALSEARSNYFIWLSHMKQQRLRRK